MDCYQFLRPITLHNLLPIPLLLLWARQSIFQVLLHPTRHPMSAHLVRRLRQTVLGGSGFRTWTWNTESVDLSAGSLRTQSLADPASNQSTPIEWSPTSSQARPIVNDSSNFNQPQTLAEDVPLDPIVPMQGRVPYIYWELDQPPDIRPRTDQEDENQRRLNGTSPQLMVIRLMCYRP